MTSWDTSKWRSFPWLCIFGKKVRLNKTRLLIKFTAFKRTVLDVSSISCNRSASSKSLWVDRSWILGLASFDSNIDRVLRPASIIASSCEERPCKRKKSWSDSTIPPKCSVICRASMFVLAKTLSLIVNPLSPEPLRLLAGCSLLVPETIKTSLIGTDKNSAMKDRRALKSIWSRKVCCILISTTDAMTFRL